MLIVQRHIIFHPTAAFNVEPHPLLPETLTSLIIAESIGARFRSQCTYLLPYLKTTPTTIQNKMYSMWRHQKLNSSPSWSVLIYFSDSLNK